MAADQRGLQKQSLHQVTIPPPNSAGNMPSLVPSKLLSHRLAPRETMKLACTRPAFQVGRTSLVSAPAKLSKLSIHGAEQGRHKERVCKGNPDGKSNLSWLELPSINKSPVKLYRQRCLHKSLCLVNSTAKPVSASLMNRLCQ